MDKQQLLEIQVLLFVLFLLDLHGCQFKDLIELDVSPELPDGNCTNATAKHGVISMLAGVVEPRYPSVHVSKTVRIITLRTLQRVSWERV